MKTAAADVGALNIVAVGSNVLVVVVVAMVRNTNGRVRV